MMVRPNHHVGRAWPSVVTRRMTPSATCPRFSAASDAERHAQQCHQVAAITPELDRRAEALGDDLGGRARRRSTSGRSPGARRW